MLDEKTGYIVGGVVAVLTVVFGAIPKYDDYNRKKAAAAREEEEAVLKTERERVAAEAAAKATEDARWDAKLAAVEEKWSAIVEGLKGEISELRGRVKKHEHADAKNRQTMYNAAINLTPLAETNPIIRQVIEDLKAAAKVPDPDQSQPA